MFMKWALRNQLKEAKANGLYEKLKKGAEKTGLSLAYVLAIASRETNIRYISGDGGHGKGVIQIDDRYHKIAQGDYWKNHPQAMIDYGCGLLKGNMINISRRYPNYNQYQVEKVAASAYNTGLVRAFRGTEAGDSDAFTTGKNYGRDVMERKGIFTQLLAEL